MELQTAEKKYSEEKKDDSTNLAVFMVDFSSFKTIILPGLFKFNFLLYAYKNQTCSGWNSVERFISWKNLYNK